MCVFTWLPTDEGMRLCGMSWTRTYPPLRNLPARTELANCAETRMAYDPVLAAVHLFFIIMFYLSIIGSTVSSLFLPINPFLRSKLIIMKIGKKTIDKHPNLLPTYLNGGFDKSLSVYVIDL